MNKKRKEIFEEDREVKRLKKMLSEDAKRLIKQKKLIQDDLLFQMNKHPNTFSYSIRTLCSHYKLINDKEANIILNNSPFYKNEIKPSMGYTPNYLGVEITKTIKSIPIDDPKQYVSSITTIEAFHTIQMDLTDYKHPNVEQVKHLLCMQDIVTKMAFVRLLSNKQATTVSAAIEDVIKQLPQLPKNLMSDAGKEFDNNTLINLLDKHNIKLIINKPGKPCSIIENFNKQLKHIINVWIKWLDSNRNSNDIAYEI